MNWIDAAGKKRTGQGRIGSWLTTDDRGEARGGAGRGKLSVRIGSSEWNEERTFDIASDQP